MVISSVPEHLEIEEMVVERFNTNNAFIEYVPENELDGEVYNASLYLSVQTESVPMDNCISGPHLQLWLQFFEKEKPTFLHDLGGMKPENRTLEYYTISFDYTTKEWLRDWKLGVLSSDERNRYLVEFQMDFYRFREFDKITRESFYMPHELRLMAWFKFDEKEELTHGMW